MKFNKSEKKSENFYEIDFEIEADIFSKQLEKVFAKGSKKASIPGFRKGKAPAAVVKKFFGADAFFDQALNELWPTEFEQALKAAGIEDFVAVDKVTVSAVSETDGAKLKAVVVTKPKVELGKYKNIEVECEPVEVAEEEVDEAMNGLAKKVARIVALKEDRACKNGDIVNINFTGFVDLQPFEGGQCENYDLTLGEGQFIAGFEDQIVGHKKGEEFKIKVTFPKDYMAEGLAGKEAEFEIKINEIKETILPKLDDEFAKDVSEFNSLAELKEKVRQELEKSRQHARRAEIENKIFDEILKGIKVSVPEIMKQRQIDRMVDNFKNQLAAKGVELKAYLEAMKTSLEEFRERFGFGAERQIKIDLTLEEIAKQEKVVATEEEINQEMERLAQRHKMDVKALAESLDMESLKFAKQMEKTVDLLVGSAVVKEKKAAKSRN